VLDLAQPVFGHVLDFLADGTTRVAKETPAAVVVTGERERLRLLNKQSLSRPQTQLTDSSLRSTGSVADHISVFQNLVGYIRNTPLQDQVMCHNLKKYSGYCRNPQIAADQQH